MVTYSQCSCRNRIRSSGIAAILLLMIASASALTRWSSVRLVPDADMLEGGTFVLDAHAYMFSDIIDGTSVQPVGLVNFGLTEWINIEAGYTGGVNLGFKARILGETKPLMPSLALGARNFFSHREAYYYGLKPDTLDNEIFLVFGKSVDAARMRIHIGIQSIPKNEQERISPFAAIEKYFGMGLYASVEVHRRAETFCPSLFVEWRVLKQRLEVSAGVVDIAGMFMGEGVPPNSPFFSSSDSRFVRPGIWAGLRFRGGFKFGKTDGLSGVETRLAGQATSIRELRGELDSLKMMLGGSSKNMVEMNQTLRRLTDSTLTDDQRFKALAVDRLAVLKSLYEAEPFEPEAVKNAMAELIANRDRMLPALYEIVLDPMRENKIKTFAVTAIGEIGTQAASDVIIELLGQSPNPEMSIECLIALGKMKETRAVYLIQQLSNDPNDDVAFTAAEVLQKIEKETGIIVAPIPKKELPESVAEKKIEGTAAGKDVAVKQPAAVSKPAESLKRPPPAVSERSDTGLQKIEKPEFTEATVTKSAAPSKPDTMKSAAKPADKPVSTQPAAPSASLGVTRPSARPDTVTSLPATGKKDAAAPQQAPVSATPAAPPAAAPAAKKRDEKPAAPARKRIDTSKETW